VVLVAINLANEYAYLQDRIKKGTPGQAAWAKSQMEAYAKEYGDEWSKIANPPATPAYDFSGLAGLRDYGESKGLNIGWDKVTGPTIGGVPISTQGMTNIGGKYYAPIEHLNKVFEPYLVPGPGSTVAPEPYAGQYKERVETILDKYLNPEPFSYDPNTDPLFQSYVGMYTRAGEDAFQNTIGGLAGLTGGRPSSWAASAASQARNKYMQDLSNIIPALEQTAYGRYRDAYGDLAQQLQVLQGLDAEDYGKHRDTVGDYERAKEFARGVLESDRAFDRGVLESDRAFDRGVLESDRDYEYQVSRDKVLDDRWMQQFDYQKQQDIIDNALRRRQISVSEANAAMSRTNADYDKTMKLWQALGRANEEVSRKLGIPVGAPYGGESTETGIGDNRVELALSQIEKFGYTGADAIGWVNRNAPKLGMTGVRELLDHLETTGKITKTQAETAKIKAEADLVK
jgi:hypothetical protein